MLVPVPSRRCAPLGFPSSKGTRAYRKEQKNDQANNITRLKIPGVAAFRIGRADAPSLTRVTRRRKRGSGARLGG